MSMKILLTIVAVQWINLVIFAWFNRVAWARILALRQQLAVYKRKSKKPLLRNSDRLFWSLLSRLWKDWRSELVLVQPETVIRWSERKFREFWRRKSHNRPGRLAIAKGHIDFIQRISSDHPEYGEDRITLELEVKLGIRHAAFARDLQLLRQKRNLRSLNSFKSVHPDSIIHNHLRRGRQHGNVVFTSIDRLIGKMPIFHIAHSVRRQQWL